MRGAVMRTAKADCEFVAVLRPGAFAVSNATPRTIPQWASSSPSIPYGAGCSSGVATERANQNAAAENRAPTIRATDQLDREGAWPPNTRSLPTLVGPLAILAALSASSLGNARSPGWCLLWRAAQHKAYEVAPYSTTMVTSVRCLYLVTHAQHVPNLRGHDSGWQSERTTLHRRTDFRPSSAHRDFRRVSGRCRSKYVLH